MLFIYDAMQWMNGDSSGVGQTGISAGDGTNYFSLYGSGTSSVLSLPIQSNVAKSGLFVLVGTGMFNEINLASLVVSFLFFFLHIHQLNCIHSGFPSRTLQERQTSLLPFPSLFVITTCSPTYAM